MADNKKRIKYFDMVKGFAILIVVACHAYDYGLDKFFTGNDARKNFANLILGVFFLTSGYMYSKGKRTVAESTKSRVKSLLVPFWIYLLAVSFLDFVRIGIFEHKWEGVTFFRGIIGAIYGSTRVPLEIPALGITRWKDGIIAVLVSRTAPFWYIPALFAGSIFFFVIIEKLYDRQNKLSLVNVLLAAIPLMLISFIDKNLLVTWQLPWAICAGAVAALLLICGYFVKELGILNIDDRQFMCRLSIAGLLISAIYILWNTYPASFVYTDFGEGLAFGNITLFLIGSVALFIFLALIFKLIEEKSKVITGVLYSLGEKSLYIFFFHYLIIRYLDDILMTAAPSLAESIAASYPARAVLCGVYVILSVAISYYIGVGITKIKNKKKI